MAWPYLRRLFFPVAVLYLCYILLSTFQAPSDPYFATPAKPQEVLHIPIPHPFVNISNNFAPPRPGDQAQPRPETTKLELDAYGFANDGIPTALLALTACPREPNRFTGHIRLSNILLNVSMSPASAKFEDPKLFWNPTIIALPRWADNQYIIVSMVTPNGEFYRRNIICEANICHPKSVKSNTYKEKSCTDDDLRVLGPSGGLRCATTPVEVDVPPTPAEKCEGTDQLFADIPGFHDPKLLYSGRGEPILMVTSQSRYACIGLWAIDLRTVYPGIEETFSSSSPSGLSPGPLMSYRTLTELTRNPPETRHSIEKNWVLFSTSPSTSYIQYDLNANTRTFAQLVGGGLTTTNLTDNSEQRCLDVPTPEQLANGYFMGDPMWHQASPALRLILCERANMHCIRESSNTVFFAAIHRKHINGYGMPVRYERYFVVWSATLPFNILAISRHPILFSNETNRGWKVEEIWDDSFEAPDGGRVEFGQFTYTTTIAYAWGRESADVKENGVGYLDDEVIVSVGIDDQGGLYGKARASELLQCLRICPGHM